jgi:hypothetical protein
MFEFPVGHAFSMGTISSLKGKNLVLEYEKLLDTVIVHNPPKLNKVLFL